ncbi:hypothetical protein ACNQUF_11605 [Corynebacterium diphtheriae]
MKPQSTQTEATYLKMSLSALEVVLRAGNFAPAAATPPTLKANARDAIQPFHLESLSDFSGFKKLAAR